MSMVNLERPSTNRPLLATKLSDAAAQLAEGIYDPRRQLTVDGEGNALVQPGFVTHSERTFTERDPADPPKPRPVPTMTKVVNDPTDVAGFAPRLQNGRSGDPWGDDAVSGTVTF